MARITRTAVLILIAAGCSISTANAAFMFLNNQVVIDGVDFLCSVTPHAGDNDSSFTGPISGTASCGSGNYAGLAYSAVDLGAIGGLGGPAIAQITASNIVAGDPSFRVIMGGQWQDDWKNMGSGSVVVQATYTLAASVQTTGVDPGSGYSITALAAIGNPVGCTVGDGVSTLNGTCTVSTTIGPHQTGLEVESVLSSVFINPVTASDSFSITLDPDNLLTLTGLSFTDLNGNPLPFSDIQSATGIPLTSTGYAVQETPEPNFMLLMLTAFGLLITFRFVSRKRPV